MPMLAEVKTSSSETMNGRVLHEAFEQPLPVRYGGRPVTEKDPEFANLLAAGFGASSD